MAQYELTTKQKAELRKTGHVTITRNGKQVRITPSMVKNRTAPAKRASTGKVKAKGRERRALTYDLLAAQEKAQAQARIRAAGINPRSQGAWGRTLAIEKAKAATSTNPPGKLLFQASPTRVIPQYATKRQNKR